MKFPLSLLRRFLETNASLEEISTRLTAIGLEVDGIEDKAKSLGPFVVAEILSAEKHPQADKLQVCRVKAAQGELQIVCGAPNARAGIKVALANIGTVIPTNGMEIKAAKVRGVESQGMLCSADELGIGGDSKGIIELPLDAVIGESIVEVLGLGDPVIDLNVTANRGDCLGVYGVARDLAAAGMGKLKPLCVPGIETHGPCPVTITIQDSDGCPAFLGRVIRGVRNGPSPKWMQDILTAAGMRPISALVDITNYFSLAFARPLHVYDLAKLEGGIIVRSGREGEALNALNDKTYPLSDRDCVIADTVKPLGLGGVMGGSHSGVTEATTDILLEVALFNPHRIAKTGRALQIDSDARQRFERGVDAGFVEQADARATDMILELCDGKASEPLLAGAIPGLAAPIPYHAEAINQLGGTNIPGERIVEILSALGFQATDRAATPPSWRHDISQPADLAEEVLRIVGYDNIPAVSLPKNPSVSRPAVTPAQRRVMQVRRALAMRGLHETYGWGFVSEKQANLFGGQNASLKLINPISEELSVMRPSLLPHLIEAMVSNDARGNPHLALFELGAVFTDTTPGGQHTVAAGVRCGRTDPLHWKFDRIPDSFDVKADAFAALEAAGIDTSKLQITRNVPAWYHPGHSGAICQGPKNILAYFGELHPTVCGLLGYHMQAHAFEVLLDALPAAKPQKRKALTTSDFQAVTRDFAFVIDEKTPASDLVIAVNKAEKHLLRDVTVFDVYQGKGIEPGKKSIALSVTLQASDRTLTDAEIEKTSQAIVAGALQIGAVLR